MPKELSRAQRQIWTVLPGVTDPPPFRLNVDLAIPKMTYPSNAKQLHSLRGNQ